MEDNKDSKKKTDAKYDYFEEPLLFKNFRKNPININGTWNVVYVVDNKVKPDSIWEADYHVSNNFIKKDGNTYLTNEKVNTINSFLDKYFPFINPVYVQKDAVVYHNIIVPTAEPATNSLDWKQMNANATKKPRKEFERVAIPQYIATPKPVDVNFAYTTLVSYPDTILVEPAIENFIQVSWKKTGSSRDQSDLFTDRLGKLNKLDVRMYHYPQILDIAFNKPIVDVNSILKSDVYPAIIDVKPSECITDPFILDVVDDVLASQEDEEILKTYPAILDVAFAKPVVATSSNIQSDLYPHIIDVKPSECITDPFILDVIDDVLASQEVGEEALKTYPEVLDISYNKPQVSTTSTIKVESYPMQIDVKPSDCINDPLVWDLVDDILASQMAEVNETYPQLLDLSNLQVGQAPVLVSEPSDILIEFNEHEFEKTIFKPSYPLTIQLNPACEVSDPFVLDFAKKYAKELEAKNSNNFVATYPEILSVDFTVPTQDVVAVKPQLTEPQIMDIGFEIPNHDSTENEKLQPTEPQIIDIEFTIPSESVVSKETSQPTYPEILRVEFDVPTKEVVSAKPQLSEPQIMDINFEIPAHDSTENEKLQLTEPQIIDIQFIIPSESVASKETSQPTYPEIMDVVPSDHMIDPFVLNMLKQQRVSFFANPVQEMYPVQIDLYNVASNVIAKNEIKAQSQVVSLCYPDIINLVPNHDELIDDPLIKTVVVEKEVMVPVEKKIYIPVEINKPYEVVKEVNVPVFVDKPVFIDKPIEIIKDEPVEITKEVIVEKEPSQLETNTTTFKNKESTTSNTQKSVEEKHWKDQPARAIAEQEQSIKPVDASELAKTFQKDSDLIGKPVTGKCIKVPADNSKVPLPIDIKIELDKKPIVESQPKQVEDQPTMTTPVVVDIKFTSSLETKNSKQIENTEPTSIDVKPSQPTTPQPVDIKLVEPSKQFVVPASNPQIIEVTPTSKEPIQQQVQIPTQSGTDNMGPISLTINVNYGEPISVSHQVKQEITPEKTTNFTIQQTAPAIPQMEGVKERAQKARLLESHPEVKIEKKTEIKPEPKKEELPPLVQEPIIIDRNKEVEAKAPVEEVEDAFDELDDDDSEEEKNQKVYKPYITLYNGNRPMSSEHMVNRYGLDKKQLGKVEQKPKNLKTKQPKAKVVKTAKVSKTTKVDVDASKKK